MNKPKNSIRAMQEDITNIGEALANITIVLNRIMANQNNINDRLAQLESMKRIKL